MQNPLLQCWGCGEPHYYNYFPYRARPEQVSNVQETSTVGEVARSMPRINVVLEDRQVDYQPTMIEMGGKLIN